MCIIVRLAFKKIGVILCNFHSSGRDGVDKDATNKCVIELIRGWGVLQCFRTVGAILSQPNAFDISSERKA